MTDDIKKLLEDIQEWMQENDHEYGLWGAQLYQEITKTLKKYDKHTKD